MNGPLSQRTTCTAISGGPGWMDGWMDGGRERGKDKGDLMPPQPPGSKAQRVGTLLHLPPVSPVAPTLPTSLVTPTLLLGIHMWPVQLGVFCLPLWGWGSLVLPWSSPDTGWCLWRVALAFFPLLPTNSPRAATPAWQPTGHLPSTLVHTSRARL